MVGFIQGGLSYTLGYSELNLVVNAMRCDDGCSSNACMLPTPLFGRGVANIQGLAYHFCCPEMVENFFKHINIANRDIKAFSKLQKSRDRPEKKHISSKWLHQDKKAQVTVTLKVMMPPPVQATTLTSKKNSVMAPLPEKREECRLKPHQLPPVALPVVTPSRLPRPNSPA